MLRGISSAGRAPALQAGGRRFDPVILHHYKLINWHDIGCESNCQRLLNADSWVYPNGCFVL